MCNLLDNIPGSVLTTITIGSSKGGVGKSIIVCNLVVVATSDTLNIVQEAIVYNNKLMARFLLSMVMPNTIMARETIDTL